MSDSEDSNHNEEDFGWVADLDKSAVKAKLKALGVKPRGTVKQMRGDLINKLTNTRKSADSRKTIQTKTAPATSTPTRRESADIGPICDQIRKWNIKFDGVRGAVSFLERLEELKLAYNISENELLKALPELLRDKALLWYRINREQWHSYEDFITHFKDTYLPSDYMSTLEEEIRARTQGAEETVQDFEIAIRTLMRRHGDISQPRQLNILYRNLRPEYKSYIRRRDFKSIAELVKLGNEYEMLEKETKQFRPPPRATQAHSADTAYQGRTRPEPRIQVHAINDTGNRVPRGEVKNVPKCWNCGDPSHRHRQCTKPRNKFCYRCGMQGYTVADCIVCSRGNGGRVRQNRGQSGPNHPTP